MAIALLTGKHSSRKWGVEQEGLTRRKDVFLYGFLVPLLPFVLEHRLNLDASLTQRMSLALLAESALGMVVASPLIGYWADRSGAKRAWLLTGLGGALVGSVIIAVATSSTYSRP